MLTITGDRHLVFRQFRNYVERQTILPDQWIIVDDGQVTTPVEASFPVTYIRRKYHPHKVVSFCRNMVTGIQAVEYDKVIIMEDDDWYHRKYIERCCQRLQGNDLVGEMYTVYYNVRYREFYVNPNTKHSSLCQTAFRPESGLKEFIEQRCGLEDSTFLDCHMWQFAANKALSRFNFEERLCIGMKGLPGRAGIGAGHRKHPEKYTRDNKWQALIDFVGEEDARFYMELDL